MGSTISISAPIASAVEPAPRAEPAGVERTTDLQRAYREQCREALDKRDNGRDDGGDCDAAGAGRAHAKKKVKRKGEPPVAAVWACVPHQARDRAIALRFDDARRGAGARDAGVEASVKTDGGASTARRAKTSVEPRGETAMRDDSTALDAVRAKRTRTPGASIADARVSRADVETAASPASAHAARAAHGPSDGGARVAAGEASPRPAMPAEKPAAIAASQSPSSSPATATATATAAAATATAAPATDIAPATRRSPAGATRERIAGDDPGRPGDASLAGFHRPLQPQGSMHAAEPPARAHDPSRAARQRTQAGAAQADARDIRETQGTQVRYSFNSWDGRPAVDLRFDPGGAPRVVNAQPSHERVQRAMEHGVDRLTPGWTVEFDRQRADDDGGRSPWRRARQEPEEDER
ncbi:BsaU protein [Burkholderia mayonis]|uniref:BsaU protein n=1 Tax=Burkholderia mayonis TaxID=1385591 RepID=A0A1B4G232_9BURK|nr:BsaU protein [Burkholderia mayonis]AOJ09974.1 BsaU protein [Burkholderia mayonis]KVE54975.1 BsaU protein [Burkholderia mayonis]